MKLFLDDIRNPPIGWTLIRSAGGCLYYLNQGIVTEISLDHDLGDEKRYGTGYDVIKWIEEKVLTENFKAPIIHIHSGNPIGRKNMIAGIKNIIDYSLSKG